MARLKDFARVLAAIVLFGGAAWLIVKLDPAGDALSGSARAADGDTLVLSRERIRLLGIDAPELAQTCERKNGATWDCGKVAHKRLADLVSGKAVQCTGNQRDKYQRLLATCAVGKADVGAVLVREGLAVADWEYKADEVAARAAGAGIWGGRFDTPRHWRDTHGTNQREWTIFDWVQSWF